jgi:adenylosuccinate synthase
VTELEDEIGDYIQEQGKEFGATTGRRRRCGWLDLVVVRDSARLNGLSSLAITKLDVLTGLDQLKVCVGYEIDGDAISSRPASMKRMAQCTPVYKVLPGWQEDITQARHTAELPEQAQAYIRTIEEVTGIPVSIVSVGPGREETIVLKDLF